MDGAAIDKLVDLIEEANEDEIYAYQTSDGPAWETHSSYRLTLHALIRDWLEDHRDERE